MQVNTNIQANLTKDEVEIFSIIKEVIEKYAPSTIAYAVGGWTRDKLIGVPSDDIDVMLSNIPGEDFARLVTKHIGAKDAHTIRSNPEKSKHITTSKAYIPLSSGKVQEVDFAQARTEVYKEDSRIPEIKDATPQEDAFRRDLTINSVFYNINENKLEDFTGNGIKDLTTNTIRTPLDPIKTFSDDPLRIFRVIRFSSKYNGNIDPETYRAMTNPQLRDEIKKKISKERIGQEFVKMLKNPNAQKAIELLKDTGLFQDIINEALMGTEYEGKLSDLDMDQNNPHHKLTLWGHTMQVISGIVDKYKDAKPEARITMILAALMHDLGKLYQGIWSESRGFPGRRSYHGHEKESAKLVEHIFKYLKIEPYIKEVSKLAEVHMRPHQFTEGRQTGDSARRRFIREMGEMSLNWLDVFNLSVADAYAKDVIKDPEIVQKYADLEKSLNAALDSMKVNDQKTKIKPVLNGNEIMTALGIKPGEHMKELTQFVANLQDENPSISKAEAEYKLKEAYMGKFTPSAGKQKAPPPQKPEEQTNKLSQTDEEDEEKEEPIETTCSMHLLKSKIDEVNVLFGQKKYYEIIAILSQLRNEYDGDENIIRLIASSLFNIMSKTNDKFKNNDIIDYVFEKAESNFFDYVLCSYVLGILLIIDTPTKDKIVKDVAKRVITMSPELVKKIFKKLPKKVFRNKLRKKLEKMI